MSDQEIAKGLGFRRLVDSTLPKDWTCLRNHFGEACRHSELKTRPVSDRAFIHVTYDERLRAILCAGAGSCSSVALKTKEANRLVFQSGKAGSWGTEALHIRRSSSVALVGEYYTQRSTIVLDVGVYADWKGEVDLLNDSRGPVATFGGRWALDPLGIGFDQPVRCDSLAISVFDSMNQRVPFSVKTLCEDQNRPAGLRGTTPRVWVYPQIAWELPSYRLVVDRAIGLSGKSLAAPQMSSVKMADSAMTALSLDFEEEQPQGWHARQGYGCRSVSQVDKGNGKSLVPASGSKMLSCRMNRVEGYSRTTGQIKVPPGSTHLIASIASIHATDSNQPIDWGGIELTVRVSHSESKRFPGDVLLTPDPSSDWTTAKLPLPQGVQILEIDVGVRGCQIPSGSNCDIDRHIAIDNIRFD